MEKPITHYVASKAGEVYARLKRQVIDPGLCTHCGTCAGLSGGQLEMRLTARGPLPNPVDARALDLPEMAFLACPGKMIDYPALYRQVFGRLPENWLAGCFEQFYIGYSQDPEIRRKGASGGVITHILVDLLERGEIDGAVVVRQGRPKPWLAEAMIATTRDDILAASQSVYIPVPVNSLLGEMAAFQGRLAYVGLPDQVAALRRLQQARHPGAQRVRYVLGPYMGTAFYLGAIESFLRSSGVKRLDDVTELRYREGEWPGYLQIRLRDGRALRAGKFYYNYLTPFFITRSALLSVDFTNELTDISVGDAWHPRYEGRGGGYSVVLARTPQGQAQLDGMAARGLLALEEIVAEDALTMHGHMLDFKKRGAFIRIGWRKALGQPVPQYGYRPEGIPVSRFLVEVLIAGVFLVCGTRPARWIMEAIPLKVKGPLFDILRKNWKALSKPTKRRGLGTVHFQIDDIKGELHA